MRSRAQKDRLEFQLFIWRVFAPYCHFRRNRETGSYASHTVHVAWRVWQAAQYSPYRPIVDAYGESIDAPSRSKRQKAQGTSRPKRRP